MALPDLTGINIENSYQRVVHTDGVNYYNGTGSLLNIKAINTGSFATTGSNQFNGSQTITGSLSQGIANLAIGEYSHAEGTNTRAIGNQSHAEGAGSKTGNTAAYLADPILDGVLTLRGASYGDKSTEFSAGSTIIFDDVDFDNTHNRTTFVVLSSTFDGTNTLITLTDNTVQGSGAIIGNPDYITSWTGDQTLRGDYAHAEGVGNIALGNFSHAEGSSTLAVGDGSHAEGFGTKTLGAHSHAEGAAAKALGTYSHAEGVSTQAVGFSSHAEGDNTNTGQYGYYSPNILDGIIVFPTYYGDVSNQFVPGNYIILYDYDYDNVYNTARFEISSTSFTGGITRVFLVDTTVSTPEAIIGVYNSFQPTGADKTLGGYISHAEGASTKAIGPYSHAEGNNTVAIGYSSHVEGLHTISQGKYQHVQGQYNVTSSAQSAFIVGNGTADNARSNLIFASGSSVQVTGSLSVTDSLVVNNVDIQATIVAMAIALG